MSNVYSTITNRLMFFFSVVLSLPVRFALLNASNSCSSCADLPHLQTENTVNDNAIRKYLSLILHEIGYSWECIWFCFSHARWWWSILYLYIYNENVRSFTRSLVHSQSLLFGLLLLSMEKYLYNSLVFFRIFAYSGNAVMLSEEIKSPNIYPILFLNTFY